MIFEIRVIFTKEKEESQDDNEDEGVRRESDLREEISHLRDARDSLMVRRQKLDTRIHRVSHTTTTMLRIMPNDTCKQEQVSFCVCTS